jgi:hypothetical protein
MIVRQPGHGPVTGPDFNAELNNIGDVSHDRLMFDHYAFWETGAAGSKLQISHLFGFIGHNGRFFSGSSVKASVVSIKANFAGRQPWKESREMSLEQRLMMPCMQ